MLFEQMEDVYISISYEFFFYLCVHIDGIFLKETNVLKFCVYSYVWVFLMKIEHNISFTVDMYDLLQWLRSEVYIYQLHVIQSIIIYKMLISL